MQQLTLPALWGGPAVSPVDAAMIGTPPPAQPSANEDADLQSTLRLTQLWPRMPKRRGGGEEESQRPPNARRSLVPTSSRTILPHDLSLEWAARPASGILPAAAFNESLSTRARRLLSNRDASAFSTACNTRRAETPMNDSEEFTTPIPLRRRATIGTVVDDQPKAKPPPNGRWSTPLPQGASFAAAVKQPQLPTAISENAPPLNAIVQITPSPTGGTPVIRSLASDEPMNRKRGRLLDSDGKPPLTKPDCKRVRLDDSNEESDV